MPTSNLKKSKIIPTKKFILFFAISTTCALSSNAQTAEPSAGVSKNTLQIELESLYAVEKENTNKTTSWSTPNALFRYGLSNKVELQLNTPLVKENIYENNILAESNHQFEGIQVGLSLNLWEQKKLLPEAALMVRAIVPTTGGGNMGKLFSLNLSNSFAEKWLFNYNIGYVVETDNSSTGFFIGNLSYEMNDTVHFFVETFGDFNKSQFENNTINTGVGFNIGDAYVLDFSVAKGLSQDMYYFGGIFTWVLNTK